MQTYTLHKAHVLFLTVFLVVASAVIGAASRAEAHGLPVRAGVATGESLHFSPLLPIDIRENTQHLPSVAYNWRHDEYLVVWHNKWAGGGRDIYARRVGSGGQILSGFAVSYGTNDRAQPSVAYDPDHDRYLITWIYDVNGDGSNWDVYGRFIPWSGPDAALTAFPICQWSSSQWNPRVTYNEHLAWPEFLVVWSNQPPGQPHYVSGRRIFAGGGFPPGDGFTIASDAVLNYINADVAYNLARNEYLVTFSQNQSDIYAARVGANGNLLDGGEFGVAAWPAAESAPRVAACPEADNYYVVWQSLVGGTNYDIYGRFVAGDGTPGTVQHIYGTTANDEMPDVACGANGNEYLVVWSEQFSNLSGPYGISARLLGVENTLGEVTLLQHPQVAASRLNPAVAAGAAGFLVSWEHERAGTAYMDIYGRTVSAHAIYLPLLNQ